jgi:hypothetical protein
METQLKIIGALLIALALLHGVFPTYFRWSKDLAGLQPINRQMMYVHAFFVALTVFLMGVFCLTCSPEIAGTPLGRKVACGFAVFWAARLLVQFFGYSSSLWRGKTFETAVHVVFTLFWIFLTAIFSAIAWAPARTMPW